MAPIIDAVQTELEFVKQQLALRTREEWFVVAKRSKVPFSTLKRIGYGMTDNPRYETVRALYDELAKDARQPGKRPRRPAKLPVAA